MVIGGCAIGIDWCKVSMDNYIRDRDREISLVGEKTLPPKFYSELEGGRSNQIS